MVVPPWLTLPPNCGLRTPHERGPNRRRTCPSRGRSLRWRRLSAARPAARRTTCWSPGCGPAPRSRSRRSATSSHRTAGAGTRGPAAATLRVMSGPDVGTRIFAAHRHQLHRPGPGRGHPALRPPDLQAPCPHHGGRDRGNRGHELRQRPAHGRAAGDPGHAQLLRHRHPGRHHRDGGAAGPRTTAAAPTSPLVDFNRSPRVLPRFEEPKRVPPAGPKRPEHQPFPYIMLMAPLLMGGVLFAVTQNLLSVLFMAHDAAVHRGPLRGPQDASRRQAEGRPQAVQRRRWLAFREDIDRAAEDGACRPAAGSAVRQRHRGRDLQTRPAAVDPPPRTHSTSWGCGSGWAPHRRGSSSKNRRNNDTEAQYMREIQDCLQQFRVIEGVPIVSQLRTSGSLGVAGDRGVVDDVARGMVLQLVGLHSPAEVVLTAITSAQSRERWDWLQWLPHVGSGHSPLSGDHLAAGSAGGCIAAGPARRPARRAGGRGQAARHRSCARRWTPPSTNSKHPCCPPCW